MKEIKLDYGVTAIAWSPDGKLLATSEKFDTLVKMWNVDSGKLLWEINKINKGSERLLFTPDGKSLITSSLDGYDGTNVTALSIIDVSTGTIVKNVDGPGDPRHWPRANAPKEFVLSPDGDRLYVSYNPDGSKPRTAADLQTYVYTVATWAYSGSIPANPAVMVGGPSNDKLTTVEYDGLLHIWDVKERVSTTTFPEFAGLHPPHAAALSIPTCRLATGAGIVSGVHDRVTHKLLPGREPTPIKIWDVNTGQLVGSVMGEDMAPISNLTWSPDGGLLAAAARNKLVTLYKVDEFSRRVTLQNFDYDARQVLFNHSGRQIAVAGDNKVLIFELR